MRILLVEDERDMASWLMRALAQSGFVPDHAADARTAEAFMAGTEYDAIVTDLRLPDKHGLVVLREMRNRDDRTPVLLLTARDAITDKVNGLDSGADDYMTKPFSPAELLARLRALTRRQGEVIFEKLEFGDIRLDLDSCELTCGTKSIHLGFKEFSILKILMANPGQAIPKGTLLAKVWGIDSDAEENNVEAYISFLRKKLAFLKSNVHIDTLRKVGYRLEKD